MPPGYNFFAAKVTPSVELTMYRRTSRPLVLMFTLQNCVKYSLIQSSS